MILALISILTGILVTDLPTGSFPEPVSSPHFPSPAHAFVWRNWQLVPADRIASTIGARTEDVIRIGRAMGLDGPPRITPDQQRRSYITVIRRNWHLLPYDQLLKLLGWSEEKLAFTLREDDFLYVKLGSLKPKCKPIHFAEADEATRRREREIAEIVRREFPAGVSIPKEPLFDFVRQLSTIPQHPTPYTQRPTPNAQRPTPSAQHPTPNAQHPTPNPHPRFCYSYFALYGDPLLDKEADPYPEGYLARLAKVGVNGVWLQGVLYKLAPFPWNSQVSDHYKDRLANLSGLVKRARKYGIDVYLYLNEPRAMPQAFFQSHADLKGVPEGEFSALCTSSPQVRDYITSSVSSICRAVPDLGGIFTITASENLTNCWSHNNGRSCPRCGGRSPAEVVAEVNSLIEKGIERAGTKTRLIAWDWGWADAWTAGIIDRLPSNAWLMSVSEWDTPISRGGIESQVGEYSLSTVGPGPRAKLHWELARQRGLKTIAKIQAANSWELSAVPYIPAVRNTAEHAVNLSSEGVDGIMLGWTLGGYPSPNLEVVNEVAKQVSKHGMAATMPLISHMENNPLGLSNGLRETARARFGEGSSSTITQAWRQFSAAFREFPFHVGTVYSAPLQMGPANLLWEKPTGFHAAMVGIPYDDLNAWRSVYPADVFADQLAKVADGFDRAIEPLRKAYSDVSRPMTRAQRAELGREIDVADACAIHFQSVSNQTRFIVARDALNSAKNPNAVSGQSPGIVTVIKEYEEVLIHEISLARRLHAIQSRDSRIGFEATNHYYYVPMDLVEKVINCRYLLQQLHRN